MKVSLIIPTIKNNPNWMEYLVPELMDLRNEVVVNYCTADCDVILGMSHNMVKWIVNAHMSYPMIPLVTLNQDWYDYVDKTKDGWDVFFKLMKKSREVWSLSKSVADKCEKETGLESRIYTYAYILPWEWEGDKRDDGYVIQGSRQDKNKRFDWFIKACEELEIPYRAYYPGVNSRPDYIRAIKNCSFVVMASKEESIGGVPLMEGSYCGKPILCSDNEGAKEVWGDDANYFKNDSYEDFKKQLKWLWENRNTDKVRNKVAKAQQKVKDRFMPENWARLITARLREII